MMETRGTFSFGNTSTFVHAKRGLARSDELFLLEEGGDLYPWYPGTSTPIKLLPPERKLIILQNTSLISTLFCLVREAQGALMPGSVTQQHWVPPGAVFSFGAGPIERFLALQLSAGLEGSARVIIL